MYQVANFGYSVVLPALNGGLNVTNGLSIIPGTQGDVILPANLYYSYPLYWQLPEYFLGDKVRSLLMLFYCLPHGSSFNMANH